MSRSEEFHGGRHRKETVSTRGGIIVSCEHCGWIGTPPSGVHQSQVFRNRGEANYAYDAHVAEAKGLPTPVKYDESGNRLKKYSA
jgi:hypothetical protein